MTPCSELHQAFARGFDDGAAGRAAATARQAAERFPAYGDLDVTVYLNGAEDGARGDRFRLDMPCDLCGYTLTA